PTLPKFIAQARTSGDREQERDLVLWPLVLVGAVSLVLVLALQVVGALVPPERLISASPKLATDLVRNGYVVGSVLAGFSIWVSVQPAMRSGYQEIHYNSLYSCAANIITLILLFTALGGTSSIALVMLILTAPLNALLVIDVGVLLVQRPYLAGR